MAERNREKAALLYEAIDRSGASTEATSCRRLARCMNCSDCRAPSSRRAFLAEAGERGLIELKGHRSVGGIRASIYNAMPLESVRGLVEFITEFRS
jgi:phosphoserine aminotransferase